MNTLVLPCARGSVVRTRRWSCGPCSEQCAQGSDTAGVLVNNDDETASFVAMHDRARAADAHGTPTRPIIMHVIVSLNIT